jgi:uncharacterized protein
MTGRPEALVRLRVQPRASRDELVAWQDDALRVRVTAPPVDGEANDAVRTLLARALGVAPSTVAVVRGERSRDKVVRIAGLSLADVRSRLAAVIAGVVVALAALSPATLAHAEHLTLDPGARSLMPLDSNFSLRMEDGGFHINGRFMGLGMWLRGKIGDRGVTLDGQLQGDTTYNFRLDADNERGLPRLRIEAYPGTL